MPKIKKMHPPQNATVFSEIRAANILPPITATPVHMQCPKQPPTVTPYGFLAAANAIVAI
jgi:hypothetical protein